MKEIFYRPEGDLRARLIRSLTVRVKSPTHLKSNTPNGHHCFTNALQNKFIMSSTYDGKVNLLSLFSPLSYTKILYNPIKSNLYFVSLANFQASTTPIIIIDMYVF